MEHLFQYDFMTRNNLRDHLSWLLANIPLNAPNAPSLPPAHDQSANNSQTDQTEQRQETFIRPSHVVDLQLSSSSQGRPTFEVPKPPRPPSTSTTSMGKLVSASKSRRPHLISQQQEQQLLTPTSTTSTTRTTSRSTPAPPGLQGGYSELLRKTSVDTTSTLSTSKKKSSPKRRLYEKRPDNPFRTPGPTLSSNATFDTVDLTGDGDQTSPVSVAFGNSTPLWTEDFASRPEPLPPSGPGSVAFGEDVTLWTEGHATRVEPLTPKRGKKRKSEDMSQPLPSSSIDDVFNDIDDILSAE